MPLFSCHFCTQQIDADDTLVGAQVECPTCAVALRVPPPAAQPRGPWEVALPLLGTLAAFGISLIDSALQPANAAQSALGGSGLVSMMAQAIGATIALLAISTVLGLILAGILTAFKKPLAPTFAYTYGILMAVLAVMAVAGKYYMRNFADKEDNASYNVYTVPGRYTATTADYNATVSAVAKAYGAEIAAVQSEYQTACNAVGMDKLLVPERVAADVGFQESYAILAQARRVTEEFRKKTLEAVGSFSTKLEAAGLSPEDTRRALADAEKGLATSIPAIKESWEIEVELVDQLGVLIGFLEASRDRWLLQAGQFGFQDDKDLEKFNAIMATFNEKAQYQAGLKQKMIQ